MRIDKNEPHNEYKDFWDWLFRRWNAIFIFGLLIGYIVYLRETREI